MIPGTDSLRLHEAAIEALIVRARSFDPARGLPIKVYLTMFVKRAMVDEFRRMFGRHGQKRTGLNFSDLEGGNLIRRTSGNGNVSYYGTGSGTYDDSPLERVLSRVHDPATEPQEIADANEQLALVWSVLEQQTRRTQQVFTMIYVHGMRQMDVAEHLGVTEGRISQLHTKGIERVQEALVSRERRLGPEGPGRRLLTRAPRCRAS